jgi:hypothetical protein
VIIHLYKSFRKLVAVDVKQSLTELKGNSHAGASNVLEGVKKYIVCVLVVASFLFLAGDVNSNLHSLAYIANRSIQLKGPLWFLWNVVGLTH